MVRATTVPVVPMATISIAGTIATQRRRSQAAASQRVAGQPEPVRSGLLGHRRRQYDPIDAGEACLPDSVGDAGTPAGRPAPWPAPGCTIAGWARNADVLRLVVAEDVLIAREGIVSMLEHGGDIDVVAVCRRPAGSSSPRSTSTSPTSWSPTSACRRPATDEGIQAAPRCARPIPRSASWCCRQYVEPAYALALLAGGLGAARLPAEGAGQRAAASSSPPIREVAGGGSVVDPKVVEALVAAQARAGRSPLDQLTPREREVLAEIAQGKSNAAVAAVAVPQRASRREAHQLAVLQARADRGARRAPPGQGGAAVPVRAGHDRRGGLAPTRRHRRCTLGRRPASVRRMGVDDERRPRRTATCRC